MTFIEERNYRTVLVLWMGNIRIKMPAGSGSLFYNCRHFFSILLLALVDANYCFIAVDVGVVGKSSDSNVFKNKNIGRKLELNQLGIPGSRPLPNDENGKCVPFMIVVTRHMPCQNMCYGATRIGILAFNNEYTTTD